jgi:hypothetical protein
VLSIRISVGSVIGVPPDEVIGLVPMPVSTPFVWSIVKLYMPDAAAFTALVTA